MNEDAKSSISLWIYGIAFASLFWAVTYFDLFANVPNEWVWVAIGCVIAVNIYRLFRMLRSRRITRTGNVHG